jgi:hypothetical protein
MNFFVALSYSQMAGTLSVLHQIKEVQDLKNGEPLNKNGNLIK